jgi:DNA repair exonuclease SbcCD nuclease subunit
LALDQDVDAFLIAGDLFDSDHISFQTEALVVAELTRLVERGIQVVYATGNHDPGSPGSRVLEMAFPTGVAVVSGGDPRRIEIEGPDGTVVGVVTAAGHDSPREARDLARGFPQPDGTVAEIALLHTQVTGSSDEAAHSPYAPSVLAALEASGFDYWAIGHVHLRQSLSSSTPIHYPGNPQGQTPREDGAKGCLLVDLSDRRSPSVTFHELSPVRWVRVTVDDLESCRNLDDVVERVTRSWAASTAADSRAAESGDCILHLILTGSCPIWRTLTLEDERRGLAETITTRLGVVWTDIFPPNVRPILDLDEHVGRPDVLGETLRMVRAVSDGAEALPVLDDHELALPHLVEVRDTTEYLSSLLEGAAEDVLTRMLRHEGTSKGTGGR